MGNFYRRRSNAFHAAHAVLAAQGIGFDPSVKPDAALIASRQTARPKYQSLAAVPADADYLVLDVPFGKRGCPDVRNWAKRIGARWNTSHKEWRITAYRVDADRLAIINSLRLYLSHTTKAAPVYLARIGSSDCVVFLQIPFEDKDTAKADGARWDTASRRWYFSMRGNLGSAAFSQKVAKYEAKGWVDVAASEAHNAPYLNMTLAALAGQREGDRQWAESKAFIQGPTVSFGGTNPTQGGFPTLAFSVSASEKHWLRAAQSHANSTAECADQWLLRRVESNGLEAWIRIGRIDGCPALRMQFRGGYTGAKWDAGAFDTAEKIRETWNQAIAGGYQLYAHQRMTGAQFVCTVATGKYNSAPTHSEISAANEVLRQRAMGKFDALR